jgi:hypothetical protein
MLVKSTPCVFWTKRGVRTHIFIFYLARTPGVLKLGVATLFRVAKYFLRVAKIFLSHHSTLDSLEFVAF